MNIDTIEETLQTIKSGLLHPQEVTKLEVVNEINYFQQDPSILNKHLSVFIKIINNDFIKMFGSDMPFANNSKCLLQAEYFYNFSKICSWKFVDKHLSTSIAHLQPILKILQEKNVDSLNWHILYFLLSWIGIILLSPFDFRGEDRLIWELTSSLKSNQVLDPIICRIHALLYSKSDSLFESSLNTFFFIENNDYLTLNYYLKNIIHQNERKSKTVLIQNLSLLNKITEECLIDSESIMNSESSLHLILKILPKLLILQSYHDHWDMIEDIISWYLSHLDSDFTEIRFSLAHSFKKIVLFIMNDIGEPEMALELIETQIDDTVNFVNENSFDVIDINRLHTYLLILAECSPIIVKNLPQHLSIISSSILEKTTKFQQLHLNSMIKGSQIKDASNFIYWSWARCKTLPINIIRDSLKNLLVNSLYDRDFIIRKSSNAALQELLGRHGKLILGDKKIMSIIQLPIHNLNKSYSENLVNLHKTFVQNDSDSNDILNFTLDWLLQHNLLENLDYNIVKSTVAGLCTFATKCRYDLYPKLNLFISKYAAGRESAIFSSRILYLLLELSNVHNFDVASFNDYIHSFATIIKLNKFPKLTSNKEHFQFLSILKYWNHCLSHNIKKLNDNDIQLFFLITKDIKETNPWFSEFNSIVNKIMKNLATSGQEDVFFNKSIQTKFWDQFYRQFYFNKSIICASFPQINIIDFFRYFDLNRTTLTCQSKALVIGTIIDDDAVLCGLIKSSSFWPLIVAFLTDYTITEQGDVGRLVRYKACLLVQKCSHTLPQDFLMKEIVILLIGLAAQPAKKIRKLAIKILLKDLAKFLPNYANLESKELTHSHNTKLLTLQLNIDQPKIRKHFWRSYSMYGGAVHSTEEDLCEAIDDFIKWYLTLSNTLQDEVLHDIIVSIPSASETNEDPYKINLVVTSINFLERVWSSRIACGNIQFNWDGVYAKIHNLMLLKINGSNIVRSTIVGFLPFLAIAWRESGIREQARDMTFVNNIIRRLLKSFQQNKISSHNQKIPLTGFQQRIIAALAQIYLEFESQKQLDYLRASLSDEYCSYILDVSQLLLNI